MKTKMMKFRSKGNLGVRNLDQTDYEHVHTLERK